MIDALVQLGLFSAKALIIVVVILLLLAGIIAILSRGKASPHGKIEIKNLSEKYTETKERLLAEILPKNKFKKFVKEQTATQNKKAKALEKTPARNLFILNFHGDIKASAVSSLREEITAVLSVATPKDEVLVRIESAGGMVHAYGLAAAQLARIREKRIPLTVSVDKVAASGGYLMACIADRILATSFAIIGSIGVVVQIPNFHRLLKEKKIDFELLTAGDFKRTLTLFGHNTEEGREKMQEEIDQVHELFKRVIAENREEVDIKKVSTGEYWLGAEALELNLVDEITTSDDYLQTKSETANLYEITYQVKKSLASRLTAAANILRQNLFGTIFNS